jgi:DNA-binding transcriptional MocR family regulator
MLKKIIVEPDFGKLLQYGSSEGSAWQKEAAIKLIRKAGYNTTADHLIPATGGQNAIAAILAGLFHAGDRIGTDPLTYPGVKTTAKMLGIELIPIQHENDEISEAGLLHACKNEHIKGLYIMPDYQNPTTHIMSLSSRKMIAKIAKENNLIVIEDGAHSLLNENPLPAVASFAPDHTVYISSLSKTVAPGFRLAYVVSPLHYKSVLSGALYNLNLSLSPFLTELASRMIASESVDRIIKEHRQLTRNRNHIVNQYLPRNLLIGPDECIFRWLLLPKKYTGKEFEKLARQAGVQVYASERFAVGKAKPPAAIRIVVTAPETIDELRTGLEVLKKLLFD